MASPETLGPAMPSVIPLRVEVQAKLCRVGVVQFTAYPSCCTFHELFEKSLPSLPVEIQQNHTNVVARVAKSGLSASAPLDWAPVDGDMSLGVMYSAAPFNSVRFIIQTGGESHPSPDSTVAKGRDRSFEVMEEAVGVVNSSVTDTECALEVFPVDKDNGTVDSVFEHSVVALADVNATDSDGYNPIETDQIHKAVKSGETELTHMKSQMTTFRDASGFHRSANLSVFLAEPPEAAEDSWEMTQWKLATVMESVWVKGSFTLIILLNVRIH